MYSSGNECHAGGRQGYAELDAHDALEAEVLQEGKVFLARERRPVQIRRDGRKVLGREERPVVDERDGRDRGRVCRRGRFEAEVRRRGRGRGRRRGGGGVGGEARRTRERGDVGLVRREDCHLGR